MVIRGHRGHPEVRDAYVRFTKWLRRNYEFPIRVPVYLNSWERHVTVHGELASASFFGPFSPDVQPYIRIATGDYPDLRKERGRDNALASYLHSLCHEVVHYQQWAQTGEMSERGVWTRAATMVKRYSLTVDHP